MTDPRRPDCLRLAAGLPAGSWVILRHYGEPERPALGHALAALCRRRRLKLIVAADAGVAAALRADGIHLPRWLRGGAAGPLLWARARSAIVTASVHDMGELRHAGRIRAGAIVLSPIFPTASHPDARVLGIFQAARMARMAGTPVIGLGGMRPAMVGRLPPGILAGFASIGF